MDKKSAEVRKATKMKKDAPNQAAWEQCIVPDGYIRKPNGIYKISSNEEIIVSSPIFVKDVRVTCTPWYSTRPNYREVFIAYKDEFCHGGRIYSYWSDRSVPLVIISEYESNDLHIILSNLGVKVNSKYNVHEYLHAQASIMFDCKKTEGGLMRWIRRFFN